MTSCCGWWRFACLAVLVAGCATTAQQIPIVYAPETPRPSAGAHDYGTAVQAIASVMVEDLQLPRLESVFYLYPSGADYATGLKSELRDRPDPGGREQALAIASCGRRKVLANAERLARVSWPDRVRTIAHEMIHLAEFALADWRCAAPHYWLMEGFAQWGAYRVTDRLGLDTFAAGAALSSRDAGSFYSASTLPPLDGLTTEAEWEAAERSVGREAVYGESFLAVDFLIERKGLPAVLDYFARFRDSAARGDHFSAAFGEDVDAFQAEFDAHLNRF